DSRAGGARSRGSARHLHYGRDGRHAKISAAAAACDTVAKLRITDGPSGRCERADAPWRTRCYAAVPCPWASTAHHTVDRRAGDAQLHGGLDGDDLVQTADHIN